MKMINVLRITMTVDIPIDNPGKTSTVVDASASAEKLIAAAEKVGQVESKVHFQRVRVPETAGETNPSDGEPGGPGE